MAKQRPASIGVLVPRRYRSPDIPLAAIRRYARQIADQFHPDQIILFGSYAYGTPHEHSDVDLNDAVSQPSLLFVEAQV